MRVINLHKERDLVENQDYTPIYRGTPYGNVFDLKTYRNDRGVVIELFRERLLYNLTIASADIKNLQHLFVKDPERLGCFCAPLQCHGDIYVRLHELWKQHACDFIGALDAYKRETGYIHYPLLDGVRHINTYSKGRTELGRLLSNFAHTPFEHPTHGLFESMEGYWYWCSTGKKHNVLKTLYGFDAKKAGTSFEPIVTDSFEEDIYNGLVAKLTQTPRIVEKLRTTHLPLVHYYAFGEPDRALVREASPMFLRLLNRAVGSLFPTYTTIIAGSRNISDKTWFENEMTKVPWRISRVIEGGAKGIDLLGSIYAKRNNIPLETVEADWRNEDGRLDKAAGIKRNVAMGELTERGVVFIKDNSKGSTHMANWLESHDKKVHIVHIESPEAEDIGNADA